MDPYYQDDTVTLWHGDCLDVLRGMPDASIHAVVTDPPYGLGFMGKEWDTYGGRAMSEVTRAAQLSSGAGWTAKPYGASAKPAKPAPGEMRAFQSWCESWAAECLRVLKPGGHLLAFGGSRTWHRLAAAIEDAGFEIRDSIAWLYGSGFPKSLDVSKAIDKAAGAEREVVGVGEPFGRGSLRNRSRVDAGYRPVELNPEGGSATITAPATPDAATWQGWGTALKPAFEPVVVARKPLTGTVAATVLTHGTGALNVDACRVETDEDRSRPPRTPNAILGNGKGTNLTASESNPAGRWPTNVVLDQHTAAELDKQSGVQRDGVAVNRNRGAERPMTVEGAPRAIGSKSDQGYGGEGGASRFFPVFRYEAKAPTSERPRAGQVAHPTVKPLDLMRWLVRLVTPPGGTVLDPFAGSGTTAEACVIEGFRCVTIEREADYLPLITARLSKPLEPVLDLGALA